MRDLGAPPAERERYAAAEACIETLAEDLERLAAKDQALEKFLSELRRVDLRRDFRDRPGEVERSAPHSLGRALSDVLPEWKLGNAVVSVAPLLDWRQVYRSDEIDPHLQRNMSMASLAIRCHGLDSKSLYVGLFLLATYTNYPLHSHTAPEVYYCISGRLTLQHGIDGEPFCLVPGKHSVTPSERLHALRTGNEPALLFYIWLQRPKSENWWWAQEPDGSWVRSAWQWESDGRWVRIGREAVSAETMRKGSSHYCGTE